MSLLTHTSLFCFSFKAKSFVNKRALGLVSLPFPRRADSRVELWQLSYRQTHQPNGNVFPKITAVDQRGNQLAAEQEGGAGRGEGRYRSRPSAFEGLISSCEPCAALLSRSPGSPSLRVSPAAAAIRT